MQDLRAEIADGAARLVVEDGLDYATAKRRAARDSGALSRSALPDNQQLEAAVRAHLKLFHGHSQPRELLALRRLALQWMDRLSEFRPHLGGAAWQGTATLRSGIQLDLYCDDPKLAHIKLLNMGLGRGLSGDLGNTDSGSMIVRFSDKCLELTSEVDICLSINDYDLIRGNLRSNRLGRSPRGDAGQLLKLMEATEHG